MPLCRSITRAAIGLHTIRRCLPPPGQACSRSVHWLAQIGGRMRRGSLWWTQDGPVTGYCMPCGQPTGSSAGGESVRRRYSYLDAFLRADQAPILQVPTRIVERT